MQQICQRAACRNAVIEYRFFFIVVSLEVSIQKCIAYSTGHTKGELSKANRYVGKLYLLSMARAARNSMSVCVCVGLSVCVSVPRKAIS